MREQGVERRARGVWHGMRVARGRGGVRVQMRVLMYVCEVVNRHKMWAHYNNNNTIMLLTVTTIFSLYIFTRHAVIQRAQQQNWQESWDSILVVI